MPQLAFIVFGAFIALALQIPLTQTLTRWLGLGQMPDLEVYVEKIADIAADTAVRKVQTMLNKATGGAFPAPESPAPKDKTGQTKLPDSSPQNTDKTSQAVDRLTNPWLYGTIGVLLLFGTTFVRQTRGLARDVGSGVSSTREAVRNDFGELQSDPGNPRRRG